MASTECPDPFFADYERALTDRSGATCTGPAEGPVCTMADIRRAVDKMKKMGPPPPPIVISPLVKRGEVLLVTNFLTGKKEYHISPADVERLWPK